MPKVFLLGYLFKLPLLVILRERANAESQKSEILGGAQNDKDELIQSAMIFGNSYNCRQQTFPISSGNKVVRKTASIVK